MCPIRNCIFTGTRKTTAVISVGSVLQCDLVSYIHSAASKIQTLRERIINYQVFVLKIFLVHQNPFSFFNPLPPSEVGVATWDSNQGMPVCSLTCYQCATPHPNELFPTPPHPNLKKKILDHTFLRDGEGDGRAVINYFSVVFYVTKIKINIIEIFWVIFVVLQYSCGSTLLNSYGDLMQHLNKHHQNEVKVSSQICNE
jgi:hypothetical protein